MLTRSCYCLCGEYRTLLPSACVSHSPSVAAFLSLFLQPSDSRGPSNGVALDSGQTPFSDHSKLRAFFHVSLNHYHLLLFFQEEYRNHHFRKFPFTDRSQQNLTGYAPSLCGLPRADRHLVKHVRRLVEVPLIRFSQSFPCVRTKLLVLHREFDYLTRDL